MMVAATREPSELTSGWLSVPVTRRRILGDGVEALRRALDDARQGIAGGEDGPNLARAPWLVVTSGFVFDVLAEQGIDIPGDMPLACVGEGTALRAPRVPDLVGPPPATAASFAGALVQAALPGAIFPTSALASTVLTDTLDDAGIPSRRIDIYTSEPAPDGVERLMEARPVVVVVTSSSAARALVHNWTGRLPALIALGQPTARTLTELQAAPTCVATTPDRRGIEECLERMSQ